MSIIDEHRNWDVGSQKRKKKRKKKKEKRDVRINGLPIIPYIYIYIYIYEPPLLKDITIAALQGP